MDEEKSVFIFLSQKVAFLFFFPFLFLFFYSFLRPFDLALMKVSNCRDWISSKDKGQRYYATRKRLTRILQFLWNLFESFCCYPTPFILYRFNFAHVINLSLSTLTRRQWTTPVQHTQTLMLYFVTSFYNEGRWHYWRMRMRVTERLSQGKCVRTVCAVWRTEQRGFKHNPTGSVNVSSAALHPRWSCRP